MGIESPPTSLADAMAASTTLDLAGQSLRLAPLRIGDLAELDRLLGDEITERAGRVAGRLLAELADETRIVPPISWADEQSRKAKKALGDEAIRLLMQTAHEEAAKFSVWSMIFETQGLDTLSRVVCHSRRTTAFVLWLALRQAQPLLDVSRIEGWLTHDPRANFEFIAPVFRMSVRSWGGDGPPNPKAGTETVSGPASSA